MWHTIKVHVEIQEANVVGFDSTCTFLKRNMWCFCDSNKLYWLCVQMSKGMQVQASEFQIFFFVGFFWSSVWFYFLTKLRAPEVINSAAYKPQKYQFYIIKYCTYKTFTKHRYKITASFVPSSQIAPFRPTVCYASPCFRDTLWQPSFVRSFKAGLEKTSARLPTPAIQFRCAERLDAPVHPQIWFQRRDDHVGL